MMGITPFLFSAMLAAWPAEVAGPPKLIPPELGVATLQQNGDIEVQYYETMPLDENRVRTERKIVDGKEVVQEVKYKLARFVFDKAFQRRSADQFKVYQDGKELDKDAYTRLLKKPTPVAFYRDSQNRPLDPFYAAFFQPSAVIVQLGGRTEVAKQPPPSDRPVGKPNEPKEATLHFGAATLQKNGDIEVQYIKSNKVYETRTREITNDGKVIKTVTFVISRLMPQQVVQTRSAGQFKIYKMGMELQQEAYKKLADKPKPVVVVENALSSPLDAHYYGTYFRSNVIVVQLNFREKPEK
jgi:hypothetical protein